MYTWQFYSLHGLMRFEVQTDGNLSLLAFWGVTLCGLTDMITIGNVVNTPLNL
jgi:hypothetical protein